MPRLPETTTVRVSANTWKLSLISRASLLADVSSITCWKRLLPRISTLNRRLSLVFDWVNSYPLTANRVYSCLILFHQRLQSRVIYQLEGERNYHIFYMTLAGASAEFKSECGLDKGPEAYRYRLIWIQHPLIRVHRAHI